MTKIEVASHQFVLKQFFVFPEHCALCLCEVLTRCHRYAYLNSKQSLCRFILIFWSIIFHTSTDVTPLQDTLVFVMCNACG